MRRGGRCEILSLSGVLLLTHRCCPPVWYGCVLRGDVNAIKVGAMSNIQVRLRLRLFILLFLTCVLAAQDGTVIHVAKHNVGGKARPTTVGDRCTVGHGAILHACTLEDESFVGMGAVLMDGVVVQKGAMVAAGALVTPGTVVPTGQIFAGSPAKLLRPMTADEGSFIARSAENYARLASVHAEECDKSGAEAAEEAAERIRKDSIDPDAAIPAAAMRATIG